MAGSKRTHATVARIVRETGVPVTEHAGEQASLPGQPHALSRFIAARDDSTVRTARWLSLALVAVLMCALLACGWAAQVLYAGLSNPHLALVALSTRILPPGAGAFLALILMRAVAVSVMGQLLVVASLVAADLKRANANTSITVAHVSTVLAAIFAACLALYLPGRLLEQSLLAFTVLGSAFGPLVIVRMAGKRVRPGAALGAMWAGAVLTVLFHISAAILWSQTEKLWVRSLLKRKY